MLEKKILVLVDYQNDFVNGSLPISGADKLEPEIIAKLDAAYRSGDKIILLKDTHSKCYADTQEGKKLPVAHCVKDTKGHEFYGDVKKFEKLPGVTVLEKLQFGTLDIPRVLKDEKIQPLEFALMGVATDICVISSALIIKSQFREVPVKIYAACCAGVTKESHDAALTVAKSCQIEVE